MLLKQLQVLKIMFLIILLPICNSLSAQNEFTFRISENDSISSKNYNLFNNKKYSKSTWSNPGFLNFQDYIINNRFSTEFIFENKQSVNSFSIQPFNNSIIYPGLGSVNQIKTSIKLNSSNRFTYEFGVGLAMQNSVLTINDLNYQFSFDALIEYSFSQRVSGYLYGQILTNPLNNPVRNFDPMIYNNPLFLQNEMGVGVKAPLKNSTLNLKLIPISGN